MTKAKTKAKPRAKAIRKRPAAVPLPASPRELGEEAAERQRQLRADFQAREAVRRARERT